MEADEDTEDTDDVGIDTSRISGGNRIEKCTTCLFNLPRYWILDLLETTL